MSINVRTHRSEISGGETFEFVFVLRLSDIYIFALAVADVGEQSVCRVKTTIGVYLNIETTNGHGKSQITTPW